jgi:hypothetical protein
MILVNSIFFIWQNFPNEEVWIEICKPHISQKTFIDIRTILDINGICWRSEESIETGNEILYITENLMGYDMM